MISINEINYNVEVVETGSYRMGGQNKIDIRLTIYPSNVNIKFNDFPTAKQIILNELLFDEFGFGIDEIKNQLPEHFI